MRWSNIAERFRSRQRPNLLITALSGIIGLTAYNLVNRHWWADAAVDSGMIVVFGAVWFLLKRDMRRVRRKLKGETAP